MRISKAQTRDNLDRMVDAAANLFREKGFDGVAVAELMRSAGLTHGGFYNHFGSKEELEAAACARVFQGALDRLGAIADIADPELRAKAFADYRRRYVSTTARDTPAPACPMVAFAGDMARRPVPIRAAFAEGLAKYLDIYAGLSESEPTAAKTRAAAIRDYATLAGALILARGLASEDPELSQEILRAAGGG
jgi:TetR/AcrR family transcriptional repressor of nem operon